MQTPPRKESKPAKVTPKAMRKILSSIATLPDMGWVGEQLALLQQPSPPHTPSPMGTPPRKLAPINDIQHEDFQQSLTDSPTWHSYEQLAAQIASPISSSSSGTLSELPMPPERRILLLSKVTICLELDVPVTLRDIEVPELPLALVFPPGDGRDLFLYRPNELRLRIDISDMGGFRWWFDDDDRSIMVLKFCGTKLSADSVSGVREKYPSNTEDCMFWEKFDWENQDHILATLKKHYITIRAHSEEGERAVGELGRLLNHVMSGLQEGERTPGYEGSQSFVESGSEAGDRFQKRAGPPLDFLSQQIPRRFPPRVDGSQNPVEFRSNPTAYSSNRPQLPIESLQKRYHTDSLPRRPRSRSRSPPRADTWRPGRFQGSRSSTRSRSPEKPRPFRDTLRRDRYPDRHASTDPMGSQGSVETGSEAASHPYGSRRESVPNRVLPRAYEGSNDSGHKSTAHTRKRPGSPIESFPKRHNMGSLLRRSSTRSRTPPQGDSWRPNRSPDRRSFTRSRSPEKSRILWDRLRGDRAPEKRSLFPPGSSRTRGSDSPQHDRLSTRSTSSSRGGSWRSNGFQDRRSFTRSRSPEKSHTLWDRSREDRAPEKRSLFAPGFSGTRESNSPQPDKDNLGRSRLPERRISRGPALERRIQKSWHDMTDQEKDKQREEIRAKGKWSRR